MPPSAWLLSPLPRARPSTPWECLAQAAWPCIRKRCSIWSTRVPSLCSPLLRILPRPSLLSSVINYSSLLAFRFVGMGGTLIDLKCPEELLCSNVLFVCLFERYLAYSYLRKTGFVVLRHNPANWTLPQLQQSEETLLPRPNLASQSLHQTRKELQIFSTEPSSSTAPTTTTGLTERQDTMNKLHFDIYQPRKSGFKITSPGRPDFCLAVYRFDQAVPSGETLVDLLRCTAGVPLRICIDSAGTLSFLEFEIVIP